MLHKFDESQMSWLSVAIHHRRALRLVSSSVSSKSSLERLSMILLTASVSPQQSRQLLTQAQFEQGSYTLRAQHQRLSSL